MQNICRAEDVHPDPKAPVCAWIRRPRRPSRWQIDPNEHSCGTVRPHGARELVQDDAGLYLAGIKSYGRAPTLITGYEQVRSIAANIAGDCEAAQRVELELPEAGVCTRSRESGSAVSGCCGGPAPAAIDACCVDDADAKAVGKCGCGCS